MEDKKDYTIFYSIKDSDKTNKYKVMNATLSECENFCKQQNYVDYHIVDLDKYSAFDLHMLTDVIRFNGKHYFSGYTQGEPIPYPQTETTDIGYFHINMELCRDCINDEVSFEEVRQNDGIDWGWGWGNLWTDVITKLTLPNKVVELAIIAQGFVFDFPKFVKDLKQNKFAVYINMEFDKYKWLAWQNGNKIRLIHQNYNETKVENEFDVIVDKKWFYELCQFMLQSMESYANADMKRYKECLKSVKE